MESGKSLRLKLPQSLRLEAARTHFFAELPGAFDTAAARPQVVDGSLVLIAPAEATVPNPLKGVVTDGHRAYKISLVRTADLPTADAPEKVAGEPTATTNHDLQPEAQAQIRPGHQEPDRSPSNWTGLAIAVAALVGAAGLAWLLRASRR